MHAVGLFHSSESSFLNEESEKGLFSERAVSHNSEPPQAKVVLPSARELGIANKRRASKELSAVLQPAPWTGISALTEHEQWSDGAPMSAPTAVPQAPPLAQASTASVAAGHVALLRRDPVPATKASKSVVHYSTATWKGLSSSLEDEGFIGVDGGSTMAVPNRPEPSMVRESNDETVEATPRAMATATPMARAGKAPLQQHRPTDVRTWGGLSNELYSDGAYGQASPSPPARRRTSKTEAAAKPAKEMPSKENVLGRVHPSARAAVSF
jgi:hypothetical protein